jgi:hypothetical protein
MVTLVSMSRGITVGIVAGYGADDEGSDFQSR